MDVPTSRCLVYLNQLWESPSIVAFPEVADFRGYGYSTGRPSLATIATDGERIAARFHRSMGAKGDGN